MCLHGCRGDGCEQSARASVERAVSPGVAQRLNAAIAEIARENNLPSVTVGVRVPGRGEYRFVTGDADLRTHTARRYGQSFRIASVTKAFTAAAVLQLIDQGRLYKIDRLAKWYPGFPNAGLITVDDLLRMRSGIAAPGDDAVLAAVYDDPLQKASALAQMIADAAKLRRRFVILTVLGQRIFDTRLECANGICVDAFRRKPA